MRKYHIYDKVKKYISCFILWNVLFHVYENEMKSCKKEIWEETNTKTFCLVTLNSPWIQDYLQNKNI